jgi:carbon monoxide dehydrogenase subunit G
MLRLQERTLFRADPSRVWEALSDWDRQASWMPDVAWMRLLGPRRELGARLQVRTKVFGIPLATDLMEVTVWEPPARLAIAHRGVVVGIGEWRLEAAEGGTRFTWVEELRMPPPLLGDLGLWLYSPVLRWNLRRSIRNLRQIVEAAPV